MVDLLEKSWSHIVTVGRYQGRYWRILSPSLVRVKPPSLSPVLDILCATILLHLRYSTGSSPTTAWQVAWRSSVFRLVASARPNSYLRLSDLRFTLHPSTSPSTSVQLVYFLILYLHFAIPSRFVISRAVAPLPFISSCSFPPSPPLEL